MTFNFKKIAIGSSFTVCPEDKKLLLIAGPCQIESEDHLLKIAIQLQKITDKLDINLIFKSSFDKANRTSAGSKRGVGLDKGLEILAKVKQETGLPVLTDIHEISQIKAVSEVVDVLQIPAFLCRQTDLLEAVAKTNKPVNLKKGQFLAPQDMKYAAEKIANQGNHNIFLCERGTCFGYRDLVVDMRSLDIMRKMNYPVIFDATHSVQSMGGNEGQSGGSREYVSILLRAAVAVGVDGVFIECHDDPDNAPSDGPNMIDIKNMHTLLENTVKLHNFRLNNL